MPHRTLTLIQAVIAGVYCLALFAGTLFLAKNLRAEWDQLTTTHLRQSEAYRQLTDSQTQSLPNPSTASETEFAELKRRFTLSAEETEAEKRRLENELQRYASALTDEVRQHHPGVKPDRINMADRVGWEAKHYAYDSLAMPLAEKGDRLKNAYLRQAHAALAARARVEALAAKNADALNAANQSLAQAYQDTRTLAEDIRAGITHPPSSDQLPETVRARLAVHLHQRPWGHVLQLVVHGSGMLILGLLCCRVLFRFIVLARLLQPVTYRAATVS